MNTSRSNPKHILLIPLALSLIVGMSACSILFGGDDSDDVGEIHTSPYTDSGEDTTDGSEEANDDTEDTPSEEPEDDQPAEHQNVEVIPVVVDQSCWVEFDSNNDISGRTPSFQALLRFESPNPEALLGAVVEITFTRPDGASATFYQDIVQDTGSDGVTPIMHITNVDPNLPAGSYTWKIEAIKKDGLEIVVVSSVEGGFEVEQRRLDGCKL